MTSADYRDLIREVGLSQVGAAKLFRVNEKTSRRWASVKDQPDIPVAVELALRLMVKFGVSPEDARGMLSAADPRPAGN